MQQRVKEWGAFWRFLLQRFWADDGLNNAAALTYTTLFAVVPMMTVTFAMLSAIPAFQGTGEQIQSFIFRNFVPSAGELVQEYLGNFTNQARQLTWIGVAVLAVTAFWMLVTIEKTFNGIWRVRQPRRGVSSFLLYWAILSLGPILLGAGFATSTYIASLSLISGPDALAGAKTLLGFMPLAFSVAAFTLLYAAVPNTRVRFKHALLGGLFTAVLFEVAKALFGLYVRLFPGYQLIYGAFATFPLFLLWIYLSWLIVLLGAELVCNLGVSRQWRQRELPRVLVMFGILRVFQTRHQSGLKVRLRDIQRQGWQIPEYEWEAVLGFLEQQQLVAPTGNGSWVLCRDLQRYSVSQLLASCPWSLPRVEQLPATLDEPWYPALLEALGQVQKAEAQGFAGDLDNWLRPAQG
ncbi:MAG: virulence factor BrkB family protein [Gammaproteobacteria bacterium]|nr:virulence factor BrkB family protein [Gammaproteobacteria bacterium]MBU1489476.1 virulence factor BrkB family protein [Gammaproteobacteria bacterium]MBU2140369.1 virulence factor BrkB family protein [Gammaproteobacteria bacterium]MBU2324252.1 virulence factor BrkB family protein [Gammaproteobacteria bacterium]